MCCLLGLTLKVGMLSNSQKEQKEKRGEEEREGGRRRGEMRAESWGDMRLTLRNSSGSNLHIYDHSPEWAHCEKRTTTKYKKLKKHLDKGSMQKGQVVVITLNNCWSKQKLEAMHGQEARTLTNDSEGNAIGWEKTKKMKPREMRQGLLYEEQQTEAISGGSGMWGSEIRALLGPAL